MDNLQYKNGINTILVTEDKSEEVLEIISNLRQKMKNQEAVNDQ